MIIRAGAIVMAVMGCMSTWALAKPKPVEPPPIVRTNTVAPPSKVFGSWRVDASASYTEAFTANESGSTFGVLCGKTCVYYVSSSVACEQGHTYPAMINAPVGAFSDELKCVELEQR